MTRDTDPARIDDPSSGASRTLKDAVRKAREDGPSTQQLAAMALALGLHGPGGGGTPQPNDAGSPASPSGPYGSLTHLTPPLFGRGPVKAAVAVAAAVTLLMGLQSSDAYSSSTAKSLTKEVARAKATVAAPVTLDQPASNTLALKPHEALIERAAEGTRLQKVRQQAARTTMRPAPTDELVLLERAHAALVSAPHKVLALAAEHRRFYPSGAFTEEREMLAVEALFRLNRHVEARRRAERLKRQVPHTAYAGRLQTLLEQHAQQAP